MWFRRDENDVVVDDISPTFLNVLSQLDQDALLIAPGEVVRFATDGVESLNILREGRIDSHELVALIRVVRRTHQKHVGKIEIPRGPIGEGLRELTVRAIYLEDVDNIVVLLSDESEAERVHEVRRDFVANISHELKTPIGALSLLSEAVLSAADEPESVVKFATRMQLEAKRLTDLVQEIINLSRLQDSDPLQVATENNVADLINEAIDLVKTTSEAKGISVAAGDIPAVVVLGDSEQLIMAIHNLLENAINYSPENTKVSVSSNTSDGIVEIVVADQGIGIPEEAQDRIFERFYRVDPARSRETGGTGLGLSIVKHVASNHGGEVKVWSSPNVGSSFALRLPIYTPNGGVTQ
ncbi:BaeS Signal transduction histidine kinase [Candidatus Nanopelagicaceae bacterium]